LTVAQTPATRLQPSLRAPSRGWLMLALLFVLVASLPNLSHPIGRDQALYCVIGESLLHGQRPYLDVWDNRPPTTSFIFAGIVKLFGPVMWCVGVVDILWLLCVSYFVFRFAARHLGTGAAFVAVGINALWHCRAGYVHAAVPSTFVIFLVFAGFFLVEREAGWLKLRHFAAGILMGTAFWTTFNALVFLPLLLLLPYLDPSQLDQAPRRLRWGIARRAWLGRAAMFAGGLATVVAVVAIYLWWVGSWAAFREIQFEVMPRYLRLAFERTPSYSLWSIKETQSALGLWTEVATLVALLVAWKQRELARLAPILLGGMMGCLCAAVQMRFHPYYFETAYPFLAMVWGYLAVKVYEGFAGLSRACATRGWCVARVLVWVLFANVVAWPVVDHVIMLTAHYGALLSWWRAPEVFYAAYPWPHHLEQLGGEMGTIQYLRENSTPEDRVFVWGTQPVIYFLSRRHPPTRFISNLGLISLWGPPAWKQELLRDLRRAPPRFIVVVRGDAVPTISYTRMDSEKYLTVFTGLAAFIAASYQPVTAIGNFVIYRRDGTPSASGPEAAGADSSRK
jgi:hypothetical protein